jgi:hypothetical protein
LEFFLVVSIRYPVLLLAQLSLLLGACSPTFNWRELRLDGAPMVALMPCRPESAVRPVPMLGQPTELHMHSCEAGGLTFALAWAKLDDAAKAPEALAQWQAASLASIRVVPGASSDWSAVVPRADQTQGVKATGTDHQGQALRSQTVYFSQGRWIYQAAIYGPTVPDQAEEAFLDGLSLP